MLLSSLKGPRVLAPPTVLLRRSMNLVRGCLEPLLHGRGGIWDPYRELVLPFPFHPPSPARTSLAGWSHVAPRKRTQVGDATNPRLAGLSNRHIVRQGHAT